MQSEFNNKSNILTYIEEVSKLLINQKLLASDSKVDAGEITIYQSIILKDKDLISNLYNLELLKNHDKCFSIASQCGELPKFLVVLDNKVLSNILKNPTHPYHSKIMSVDNHIKYRLESQYDDVHQIFNDPTIMIQQLYKASPTLKAGAQ